MGLLMGKIRPFLTELLPFFILEKWFLACYSLLFMISEWNFTDMLHIKGYILWLRTSLWPSQFVSYLPLIGLKKGFDLLFLYYMEYLNITSQICFTSKVTYCDYEPSLLPFPFCELSALDWIKKCFLPVVPLLCGIFKWNFTDMFHIKGYILWQRTITLTFPVHELSALDWSEKWFLTCCSFTIWNIWMKLHRYVDHQRLHIVGKERHSYLSRLWVIHPWLIWELVFDL